MIDRRPAAGPAGVARGLLRRVAHAGREELTRRRNPRNSADLGAILAAVAATEPVARSWRSLGRHGDDPTVVLVGPAGGPAAAVIRIARSESARTGLGRARAALDTLHARGDRAATASLVPAVLGAGSLAGATWLAERALAGRSGRLVVADASSRRALLVDATAAIAAIHTATGTDVAFVGDAEVERWVAARSRAVAVLSDRRATVGRVADAVAAEIRGRTVTTSWIHGDLWPANVLVDDAGTRVTGLVDWDSAEPGELGLHDRLHLALTTRRLVEHAHLGRVLADVLSGAAWTADDRVVLGDADDTIDGIPSRTALWLYWLRFVATNLARHPRLSSDRRWLAANVDQVLACG